MEPKIDIVGCIRVTTEARMAYLRETLLSHRHLADRCRLVLGLDGLSREAYQQVAELTAEYFPDSQLLPYNSALSYGDNYLNLLDWCNGRYVLNFIEDHFMLSSDGSYLSRVVTAMDEYQAEVCRCSFHPIELKCAQNVYAHSPITIKTQVGYIWEMNPAAYAHYQAPYQRRFYLGVNFLTRWKFARRFWSQAIASQRPHEYEIPAYDKRFEHVTLVPHQELLCAIDNDHGEPGSALMHRQEAKYISIRRELSEKKR